MRPDVEYYASGLQQLKTFLEEYPPSHVSEITGCPEDQIISAARAIGRAKAMLSFWFQGYNHSTSRPFSRITRCTIFHC